MSAGAENNGMLQILDPQNNHNKLPGYFKNFMKRLKAEKDGRLGSVPQSIVFNMFAM